MRKFRLLSLLSLAILIISAGCTKEGPEGPVGASGAQGPAGSPGAAGAPGAGQTTYSAWVTTVAGDWVVGFTAPNNYNVFRCYNRTAAGVTQAIIDQGVVLAYGKGFTVGAATPLPGVSQLPYLENFNGQHYGFILNVGKITFTYDPINGVTRPDTQLIGIAYRYIIIPGSIAGGRGVEPTYEGYTADQLKAMSYEEVAGIFHIPADGTNIR